VGAGDRLANAIREQRPVGEAGQCVVMCHVDDTLVRKAALGDFGLQSGIDAGKLQRAFLDALLERALGAPQCPLGGIALPVLALHHAVRVAHDHEQHQRMHSSERRPAPLHCIRSMRAKDGAVVGNFEHGADGASPSRRTGM
jgi:hypothetical protein